jgi:glycosyltransferase involved in cell wall biosynthesis
MAQKHPLSGGGIGSFVLKLSDIAVDGVLVEPVHNVFYLVTAELGIVGLILMFGLFISIAWNILKARSPQAILASATLTGLGVISLFDHYLWTIAPGRLLLGLALGLWAGHLHMTRDIVINGRFPRKSQVGTLRDRNDIGKQKAGRNDAEQWTGYAWEQFVLPTQLCPNYLWSPANTVLAGRIRITIHDLSPLEHPEWFRKSFTMWYRLFLPVLAKRVQVIFTPSETVKQKVLKQLKAKHVIVTPNGVDTTVFHPEACQQTYEFPQKYILFVGSLQPRKNLAGLMQAWHAVKDDFKDTWLMVAGEAGHVFQSVKFFGDERIRFMICERNDFRVYTLRRIVVLPSFDEGFGLPVIEAMACGTPVIASNGGALPEVVGNAGLIFDLSKPDGLAKTIRECLSNRNLRGTLREKGLARVKNFSWQQTAELIWKTLNEI